MPKPNYQVEDYQAVALSLLPTGPVWPREAASAVAQAMSAVALTFARCGARALALLDESPAGDNLLELLPEWEATLGLPDPCSGPDPTIALRQLHVMARLTYRGGQSIPYFIAYAAALGYTITVDEFAPMRFPVGFGDEFGGPEWAYAWRITVPAINQTFFEFGLSRFGEGFSEWGSSVLECEMRRIAPAHAVLLFAYVGEAGTATWGAGRWGIDTWG